MSNYATPTTDRVEYIQKAAEALVRHAAALGVILTVEQKPLTPLAMGHSETVVSVREAR